MPASFSEPSEVCEEALGYHFRNKALLEESLTHKSYRHEQPHEAPCDNERLEFLGDSVLNLVIAEVLFHHRPLLTEADMSKMRSYLVNRSLLSETASGLSLGDSIRLGRGEESTGGRKKQSVLADSMEALWGAVFVDSDYDTVRSLILRLLGGRIDAVVNGREGYDSKSALQEICQGSGGALPEYRIVKQEGEEHRKVFTAEVYVNGLLRGTGTGRSKKEAQMAAAAQALKTRSHE